MAFSAKNRINNFFFASHLITLKDQIIYKHFERAMGEAELCFKQICTNSNTFRAFTKFIAFFKI